MSVSKQKKKIIINHNKTNTSGVYSQLRVSQTPDNHVFGGNQQLGNGKITMNLSFSDCNASNMALLQKQYQEKISNLTEQLNHYKTKCDQQIIKVRFLYEKLETYGGLDFLPREINKQISQTDLQIKKLEEKLFSKQSKQMRKIRKKVHKLMESLELRVKDADLEQIEDEVQMILFMIDIFSRTHQLMMSEKAEVDELVQQLKQETTLGKENLEHEIELLRLENERLIKYLKQSESELVGLKRRSNSVTNQEEGAVKMHMGKIRQEQESYSSPKYNITQKLYNENFHDLQLANAKLKAELEELESHKKIVDFELIALERRKEQDEHQIRKLKQEIRYLEEQLHQERQEERKWRNRYREVSEEKDSILYSQAQRQSNVVFHHRENSPKRSALRIATFGHDRATPGFNSESSDEYYDIQ